MLNFEVAVVVTVLLIFSAEHQARAQVVKGKQK
jgi:hypothetical protein